MNNYYTMQEYIDGFKHEKVTAKSIFHQEMLDVSDEKKLIVNGESVIKHHWSQIKDEANIFIFTSISDKIKYFYKPWLFCHDKFGNSELWHLLLDLNQMRSFSEFNHDKIRIFSHNINNTLKTAYVIEDDVIKQHSSELLEKIKEASLE